MGLGHTLTALAVSRISHRGDNRGEGHGTDPEQRRIAPHELAQTVCDSCRSGSDGLAIRS